MKAPGAVCFLPPTNARARVFAVVAQQGELRIRHLSSTLAFEDLWLQIIGTIFMVFNSLVALLGIPPLDLQKLPLSALLGSWGIFSLSV